jgi:hypothetical protein
LREGPGTLPRICGRPAGPDLHAFVLLRPVDPKGLTRRFWRDPGPSVALEFVITTAPEGAGCLSSPPGGERLSEPDTHPRGSACGVAARRHHPGPVCPRYGSLHRKRFPRPRRRGVRAPPMAGPLGSSLAHPGRAYPRYGSLHRKRFSPHRRAARHGRPRARPARRHPPRPAGGGSSSKRHDLAEDETSATTSRCQAGIRARRPRSLPLTRPMRGLMAAQPRRAP